MSAPGLVTELVEALRDAEVAIKIQVRNGSLEIGTQRALDRILKAIDRATPEAVRMADAASLTSRCWASSRTPAHTPGAS